MRPLELAFETKKNLYIIQPNVNNESKFIINDYISHCQLNEYSRQTGELVNRVECTRP